MIATFLINGISNSKNFKKSKIELLNLNLVLTFASECKKLEKSMFSINGNSKSKNKILLFNFFYCLRMLDFGSYLSVRVLTYLSEFGENETTL